MKSLIVSLILFTSTLVAAPERPGYTVTVFAIDKDKALSIGSGTVVKKTGKVVTVLTCKHVLEDAETVYLRGDDKLLMGKNIVRSETDDLATFDVESDLPVAKIAQAPVIPGDVVQHWGQTSGYSKGEVSDYINLTWPDKVKRLSIKSGYLTISGDSGCGVFNSDGELVAVNFGLIGELGNREGLAIPLKVVQGFLAAK